MFNVGDLVIYDSHGICHIDNIRNKTLIDVTKPYYELHPLDDPSLKISTPVDRAKVVMKSIIERDEAEALIGIFKQPGMRWMDNNNQRATKFNAIIKTGDRLEIAKIANTLMRRKHILDMNNKTLSKRDRDILDHIRDILFIEMAIALDITNEALEDTIKQTVIAHL